MTQEVLHAEIIKRSVQKEWYQARQEWTLFYIWDNDSGQVCLCTHNPIHEICVIQNKFTGQKIEVGNCCVNNFLGLPSEGMFASYRRVRSNLSKSINNSLLYLLKEQRIITDWEYRFYQDTWRKRKMSFRQAEKRREINSKVLRALQRRQADDTATKTKHALECRVQHGT